jgi:hypothetical protein
MFRARRYISYANAATDYVTLAEAKQHLRVNTSTDDSYITGLITMAIESCSAYLGYSVRKSTARYGFDGFTGQPALINPVNGLNIPTGNYLRVNSRILSVEELYYMNSSQTLTAFSASDWIDTATVNLLATYSRNIFINTAPVSITDDLIKYQVEVIEGFNPVGTSSVDPDTIFPMSIKHAALLLVGQYYDNRQAVTTGKSAPISFGYTYLLDPYKIAVTI